MTTVNEAIFEPIIKGENNKPKDDSVTHPSHYTGGEIECIEAIAAATGNQLEGYLQGNVIKYVWRYKAKGGAEDLRKAEQYLTWLIETVEHKGVK